MVGLAQLGAGKLDSWIMTIVQGSSNLALQSLAQKPWSTNLPVILTLISLLRCLWLGFELNCKSVGDLRSLAIVECNILLRRPFFFFFPTLFMVAHQQYTFWTSPLSDPSVLGLRVLKENVLSLRKVWICMLSVCLANAALVYGFNQNSIKILKDCDEPFLKSSDSLSSDARIVAGLI